MNLYEVAVEGQELERLLEESGGELTPEMEERFDAFLKGGKDKINAALCVRRMLELEALACRQEADRLTKRARSIETQRSSLNQRILSAIDQGFQGSVKTALFTAYGQTSAPSLEFRLAADVDLVKFADQNPTLVRTTREFNKLALAALHKDNRLPREVEVDPMPGKRVLQVR